MRHTLMHGRLYFFESDIKEIDSVTMAEESKVLLMVKSPFDTDTQVVWVGRGQVAPLLFPDDPNTVRGTHATAECPGGH